MSAMDAQSNPILDALKPEIAKFVWTLFDSIKTADYPVHASLFHIPINFTIKVADLAPLITMLVGPDTTNASS